MKIPDLWEYTLQPADNGKKYEEILRQKFHFSRSLLQSLKQGEKVWVDGRFTYLSVRGQSGQRLTVELHSAEDATIIPEDLPLAVLYEDDYLLAVNKPAGQVVHPTPRYPSGTLGNAVLGYWQCRQETRPFRPVHRIDRNTSGLVIIAKNQFAHQQVAWQLERGLVRKVYLGFVAGQVTENNGKIDSPIALAPGSFIIRTVDPGGAPALTYYKTLRRFPQATLLSFELGSGRTHQIRVHCQALGHPLLGDDLYGGDISLIPRQALHSFSYALRHPATGQPLTLHAPVPQDLLTLAARLAIQGLNPEHSVPDSESRNSNP